MVSPFSSTAVTTPAPSLETSKAWPGRAPTSPSGPGKVTLRMKPENSVFTGVSTSR